MSQKVRAGLPNAPAPSNPVGASLHPALQASLVMDVALGVDVDAILEAYDLQQHELDQITQTPLFQAELKRLNKQLSEDGASFRLKASIQAEAMLERSWAMVHDPETSAAVVADLIKATVRWGGHDGNAAATAAAGAQFSININLNESVTARTELTIDHEGVSDGDD